jgi:hypothetical protein
VSRLGVSAATVTLAAACALATASACGPNKNCSSVTPQDASSAQLVAVETLPNASQTFADASSGPPVYRTSSLKIGLAYSDESASDHCLEASFDDDIAAAGFAIAMACPSGPGTFALADLHATFCEAVGGVGGGGCQPLQGSLTVRTITLRCAAANGADGACGRLDADFTASSPPNAPLPSLSGTAHLTYSETIQAVECPSTPILPGGG